jgi:Chaperone of endosialidase
MKANIICALAFALALTAKAVDPPPDGGYPGANTAEGAGALLRLTSGTQNTAVGTFALQNDTIGSSNTALGAETLFINRGGNSNTAVGVGAMNLNLDGDLNTATGYLALSSNRSGNDNTANGNNALGRNTTGSNNVALGASAGFHLTTGDNNIDIGNKGVAGESNTIRIGRKGTQQATFIAGIRGTSTGDMDAVPVVIDSDGQLGTVSSSARFKEQIKPMDTASEAILALKPITFHYKNDKSETPQFGLIAEEVAKVAPDLVVREENGEPYTVRYEAVNAMLLNEFLKEHKKVEALEARIEEQQKQIEALAAESGRVAPRYKSADLPYGNEERAR